MVLFFQQLVTGLSIGGIYALLAVGYALIYSIFNFTNFAFGSLMMAGAFAGYFAITAMHLPIILGLLFSIIFGIAASVFVELTAYRPLRQKKASRLFLMITAMGINIFITNLATVLLGANLRPFPVELPAKPLDIASVAVGQLDIASMAVSLISLLALWTFLQKTKPGLAVRASALDTATAGMMGINVNRISLIVFLISGATASVAGIFFGMKYTVYPTLGVIAQKAFISSVIGGMGSLPGAVVGGIVLGVIETMVAGYISSTYRDLFAYSLMILILLFLPNGLLGRQVQEKL
ncbi:MAG: branched-chain amino acid ABC transporter permease [Bacillota bacterium]|nr:branched-chain amino acid ABC transporter permease [Bacillota bacterium]